MNCSTALSFLSPPETLRSICHVISVIEIPFHLLGTCCILVKTPVKMRNVKRSMLNLHIITIIFDLCMSFLLIPFVTFPAMAGMPLGLLTLLNVSPTVQVYIGVTITAATGVAILTVFENRYYRLFMSSQWEKHRKCYLALNYLLALTFFSYPFFWIPDQDYGRQVVMRQLPCLTTIRGLDANSIYVFSLDTTVPTCLITFMLIIVVSQIVIMFVITIKQLVTKYQHLSKNTYQIQRKFMKALFVQFLMTLTLFAFPICLLCHSVINDVFSQAINNLCFITLSLYGLISTITMITFHQPYREWILRKKTYIVIHKKASISNNVHSF